MYTTQPSTSSDFDNDILNPFAESETTFEPSNEPAQLTNDEEVAAAENSGTVQDDLEQLDINDEEPSALSQQQHEEGTMSAEPPIISPDNQSESLRVPESGSRPYFEIFIEDPQKVGDAINAHIIYKVRTKTNSPAFRNSEFVVARRYRDFLWLYNQLTTGNPGVIVPPVPEKHALGRFQDEFVESRRLALERCLQKIVAHPMLYGDPDLKVFLESESFHVEKRQRRAEPESNANISRLNFMRPFASNKYVEVDEWFESKKNQLDALETQLKGLLKSVEGVVKQRKELGLATADFGESMFPLASAELNRNLSTHLVVLGEIQKQMKELHEEQAQHDVVTLENTIDEYIRVIGSIRIAFNARIKAYQTYTQAESEYRRKVASFERLKQQRPVSQERLLAIQQELNEMKDKVEEHHSDFTDISKLIKHELDRFDKEKVEDFRDSVEQFLRSMIEHQKQIIALWETYFEKTEGLSDTGPVEEEGQDEDTRQPPSQVELSSFSNTI